MAKDRGLTPMNGNEKGLSLIEVLVSLVILVVGLIGVFNLHIISKQGSFEAFQQTQAAFLANDIINRMQANPRQLDEFLDGAQGAVGTHPEVISWREVLVGDHVKDFSEGGEVGVSIGGLDSPVACISRDGAEPLKYIVAISWRSIREMSDAATGHYSANDDSLTNNVTCGVASKRRRLFIIDTIIRAPQPIVP